MRVHAIAAGVDGSAFYRVTEPGRVVSDLGVEWSYSTDIDVDARVQPNGYTTVKEVKVDCDVLVLQRPLRQAVNAVAEAAQRQGIAVVVEIDDDFHNLHPDHVGRAAIDPKLNPWHNTKWLLATSKLADAVTVSTPALTKYARPDRAVVVRNRIPERVLKFERQSVDTPAVGWTGTAKTHPADLAQARGLLNARPSTPFHVVGDAEGVAAALNLAGDRVTLARAWTSTTEEYWEAVAGSVQLGIAPLQVSKFNKAKSWLKPLEYAALGIPFIASPTPEYRAFVAQSGAGMIATSASTWAFTVDMLLNRPEPYSANGREYASEHTLEKHVDEWIAAWELARTGRS